jgi:hypothetical protein
LFYLSFVPHFAPFSLFFLPLPHLSVFRWLTNGSRR